MYAQTLTKIISLSDKAYEALKKRKGKGESFSDVVARITQENQSKSVLSFAGVGPGRVQIRSPRESDEKENQL